MVEYERLRRAQHVSADGVNRADARLRVFGRKVGHAVMCPACDGDGVVIHQAASLRMPKRCEVCNGEGLDPNARQGCD